jgi:hypothetical protein
MPDLGLNRLMESTPKAPMLIAKLCDIFQEE